MKNDDESKTYTDDKGYLRFKDSDKLVHLWVAEKKYGKEALIGKVIHHLDGDKKNNNEENLILLSNKDHYRLHNYIKENQKKDGLLEIEPWARLILFLVAIELIFLIVFPAPTVLVYAATSGTILMSVLGGIKRYNKK